MTPETVYLVEERPGTVGEMKYWAKVYLSREKAREGIEYWAPRAGVNDLAWEEGSFGVLIASPANDDASERSWTIVPLPVHPDNEPHRHGSPLPAGGDTGRPREA
jgi:hypothetical protein